MVEEAQKNGLEVWLYDEGGWPSGSVCGELVKRHPELKAQIICLKKKKLPIGKTVIIPKDCISAILFEGTKKISVWEPGSSFQNNISKAYLWIFSKKYINNYPDLLNPLSTQKFIQMTHEKYFDVLKGAFGKNLQLTFTDEPKICQIPWTNGIVDDFKKEKGYDVREYLCSLFHAETKADQQICVDYYDWWSKKFAINYFGQIQSWCHQHGLLSSGHLGGEDETLGPLLHGFGHMLRPLRKLDIPGVDTIWRQIWPGKKNHYFPRFAATAAHQEGNRFALTESFAVYGNGLNIAEMKWIVNYQFVRGINLLDFATYQYSNSDWFIGGERPVMGPINPLWKYMYNFHLYIARLSFLLSLGHTAISVGIYYPIRDIWAGKDDAKNAAQSIDSLISYLDSDMVEFDFIDDDVIEGAVIQIDDLNVIFGIGSMKYSILIIPRIKWLPVSSQKKLDEFKAAGGKLYFWDEEEVINSDKKGHYLLKDNISDLIPPVIQCFPITTMLRVCVRQLSNGRLYFLTNEDVQPLDLIISIKECGTPFIIDLETGNLISSQLFQHLGDKWQIRWTFSFAGSLLILFTDIPINVPALNLVDYAQMSNFFALNNNWTIRRLRSYQIKRHGIVMPPIDESARPVSLGDWARYIGGDFSGDCEYSISFDCAKNDIEKILWLDIGVVKYACELCLNGHSLGKRAWPPYIFAINGLLKEKSNNLQIIVSNTLANQYVSTRFWTKWSKRKLGPYHPKALKFERESVSSGLFGPVLLKY
jgi:hypothetical protein